MTELEKYLGNALLKVNKQYVADMRQLVQQNMQLSERVEALTVKLHLSTERLDRLTHALEDLSKSQSRS